MERAVVRMSGRGSLSAPWAPVRLSKAWVEYQVSSARSGHASARPVLELAVANVDDGVQVADMWTFPRRFGLV